MLFCLKFVECGECGRDVSVLVEAYASEEASFSTIMALQKGLCPSSDLDLETEDDVKECQQFMEDFMPIALRQIADYVIGNRRKFCNELFDVCTLDPTNEVKFIYFEKATKSCEISTVDLTVTTQDKSKVEISQNFVAFKKFHSFHKIPMLIVLGFDLIH